MLKCLKCLKVFTRRSNRGTAPRYCSERCANSAMVARHRKRTKFRAVEYLGGKCSRCGYAKCIGALHFHHKNPKEKSFGLSCNGNTRSWAKTLSEVKKCILLCANCHAEMHEELLTSSKIGIASHC